MPRKKCCAGWNVFIAGGAAEWHEAKVTVTLSVIILMRNKVAALPLSLVDGGTDCPALKQPVVVRH
ncbi:MAG: hypothetical protein ACI9I0_002806 [Rhodoferax sp.]|jgi:hypothetical protein